jgi:hypothetical protein
VCVRAEGTYCCYCSTIAAVTVRIGRPPNPKPRYWRSERGQLVDAHDSGSRSPYGRAGSSPLSATNEKRSSSPFSGDLKSVVCFRLSALARGAEEAFA